MAIVMGATWLFNLVLILGGYAVLIVIIFSSLYRINKAHLPARGLISLLLAVPVAWLFLDRLCRGMAVKELYIFTAFTEITWRPLMFWLALASLALWGFAYALRARKTASALAGVAATTLAFTGLLQAIVGLFFSGDFFRWYGFDLHY